MTKSISFLIAILFSISAAGQQSSQRYVEYASDPATMKSRVPLDAESYLYVAGDKFYSLRLSYYYGLGQRHLFGLGIPYVHNVFVGNYAGLENTSGFGDVKFSYMYVPYLKAKGPGLQRVSTYLEVSAPTGEDRAGRGAGTWLYKPGVIFTYRPEPGIAFYPEMRFQFSTQSTNSKGGGNGTPDLENPDKDGTLQNLTFILPMVLTIEEWDGWFSLAFDYQKSLSEGVSFLYLHAAIGKMITQKTAASLDISKFVAGQPRLNVVVQAKFQFFLN